MNAKSTELFETTNSIVFATLLFLIFSLWSKLESVPAIPPRKPAKSYDKKLFVTLPISGNVTVPNVVPLTIIVISP